MQQTHVHVVRLLRLVPTGQLKLYPNVFAIKTCYSLFVNVKSHLVSRWLLTWTSLFTLGGALLGELILLGLIYDTQMFRVSSYPAGSACVCMFVREGVHVCAFVCVFMWQTCSRLPAQETLFKFSIEVFLINLPKKKNHGALWSCMNLKNMIWVNE